MAVKTDPSSSVMFKHSLAFTIFAAAIVILGIAFLYLSPLNALVKWGAAIVLLIGSGEFIATINKKQHAIGMYLIGGRHGIKFVDNLSKKSPEFWKFLADWGLVLGFGLLSYPLFRKYLSVKTYIVGIITILAILFLIYPYLSLTLQFLNIPQITSRIPVATQVVSPLELSLTPTGVALYSLGLVGGFTLFTIAGIAYNGASVLYSTVISSYQVVVQHVNVTNTSIVQQIPGVAPLVPGITIPLIAGLISLAFLLIIHEFSHGVLARIAKIKIKSIGLVLVGIIPAGAFVEPDEPAVKKLTEQQQNRIFIVGVAANILAAIAFFVLFLLFYFYIMPALQTTKVIVVATVPGLPAYGFVPVNSTIEYWNGYPIKNLSSFVVAAKNDTPHSTVSIVTNKGSFKLVANATGKVGVEVEQVTVPITTGTKYSIVNFLYEVVSLSLLLNFLVGIVNMLPIPGLDGWRVYKTKLKDSRWLNALTWLVILLILLNLLPWLFIR